MNRLLLVTFSALLSISLISCKKKGQADIVIAGVITDGTFNSALNNAELKIYRVQAGSFEEKLIYTGQTDGSGSYNYTLPRDQFEKLILTVNKNNYFEIRQTITFQSLTTEDVNTRNYSTTAKSWAKIHIVNDNPQPTDHFRYLKQYGLQGCDECCPISEENYFGALDTTFYCINDANTVYSYNYWIIGTTDSGNKAVTTTPFDTVAIEHHY